MKNSTGTQDRPGIALAAAALRQGYVTAREVQRALGEQAREAEQGKLTRDIGLILLSQGVLSEETLQNLLIDLELHEPPAVSEETVSQTSPLEKWGRRFGKYVLIRELGRGTAAVTYEAHDTALERRVAIKIFNRQRAAVSGQNEERFVREARLAASFPPHPHLVTIHETGCVEGERYIVMELIRGRTFSAWRSLGAPLWKSVALLRDIGRAIHHAHEHGLLHRDLKPANILVDSNNTPHVTDFGLAKNLQGKDVSLTSADSVVGTPCYMSPEQAQGARAIDRRSDVYSLGVMLYEILTGQLPFVGKTPVETLLKAIEEPVRPPSAVLRAGQPLAVDRTIERICLRALSKSPGKRHPTALDFAEDLDRWLTGQKDHAITLKSISRGMLVVILVAIAVVAAGAHWIRSRSLPSQTVRVMVPPACR